MSAAASFPELLATDVAHAHLSLSCV